MRSSLILSLLAPASGLKLGARFEASNAGIQKVIKLLTDMRKQTEVETKAAGEEARKVELECQKTITQFEADIKFGTEKAEGFQATMESEAAKATKKAAEAEQCATNIAEATKKKEEETALFKKQDAVKKKTEMELVEADGMLTQALAIIKRALSGDGEEGDAPKSFMQMDDSTKDELSKTLLGLGAIIDAGWTSTDRKKEASSFFLEVAKLTGLNDDQDLNLSLTQQPQAQTKAYDNSRSNVILDAIAEMQDKNTKELNDLRTAIMEARHEWESTNQNLVSTIKMNTQQMEAAKEASAEAEALSGEAASKLKTEQEDLKAAQDALKQKQFACKQAKEAWEARLKEATEEMAVLDKAIQILDDKFGKKEGDDADKEAEGEEGEKKEEEKKEEKKEESFLQIEKNDDPEKEKDDHKDGDPNKDDSEKDDETDVNKDGEGNGEKTDPDDTADKPKDESKISSNFLQLKSRSSNNIVGFTDQLRKIGRIYNNYQLIQAAQTVSQPRGLQKVIKMIADLISKLQDEQAKEAAKEGKCVADKAKGEKQLKTKGKRLQKLQARADKADAKVKSLAIDIKDEQDKITRMESDKAEEDKDRAEDKEENAAKIEECKESIEALSQAIEVLKEFYAGAPAAPAFVQTSMTAKLTEAEEATKMTDKAQVIIEVLDTAQEDFQKQLQDTEAAERNENAEYQKTVQALQVALAKSNAVVEGSTKEQAQTKKRLAENQEDVAAADVEYAAAEKFMAAVKQACTVVVPSFEERQAKRKAEIDGLQEALKILNNEEGEAALLQTMKRGGA